MFTPLHVCCSHAASHADDVVRLELADHDECRELLSIVDELESIGPKEGARHAIQL